jgi:hypothetical protein
VTAILFRRFIINMIGGIVVIAAAVQLHAS